jgi:hypothetical protein
MKATARRARPADPALARVSGYIVVLSGLALVACSAAAPPSGQIGDAIDVLPVATFLSPLSVDQVARCIDRSWRDLAPLGPAAEVTLHPSFRGLMVDVRAAHDPAARSYVEIYQTRSGTRVDYFLRSFVHDPIENLRLRGLQSCL